MDEKELIKRIQRGQKELFSQLVSRYAKVVFNHSYSFLRNREDAEDAAQEVFVSVYNNIKKFRGDSKIGTWIYRITVNTCKNKLKQLQRLRSHIIEEKHQEGEEEKSLVEMIKDKESREPDNVFAGNEKRKIIMRRMGELTEEQQQAIILRDIDGMSYEEIAKVLKISVSAVKSKIFRARENLREKLEKDDVL